MGVVVKDGLSDAAGKWQISDVPVGNGTLSYTKKDFVTMTANISVSDRVPVQPLSAGVSHVLPPKDWRILLSGLQNQEISTVTLSWVAAAQSNMTPSRAVVQAPRLNWNLMIKMGTDQKQHT